MESLHGMIRPPRYSDGSVMSRLCNCYLPDMSVRADAAVTAAAPYPTLESRPNRAVSRQSHCHGRTTVAPRLGVVRGCCTQGGGGSGANAHGPITTPGPNLGPAAAARSHRRRPAARIST